MLSNADYILIPSRIESIPVIFSDALQCGRPIITTPVGDLAGLVEKYHVGICSTEASPAAYALAINESLHRSPSQYMDNIASARTDFCIDHIAEKLASMITKKIVL